jgi:neopullulanase
MTTPDWVKDAVFYQIFPDRFARSGRVNVQNGKEIKAWGTDPAEQGFQGGDLYGVVDRLDYLDDLGVTALYLNPIFSSAANHRYHTYDYYEVDPLLGGNDALRELLDAAHHRGIRVVLDGVFNHASRGFWPFHHILENGGDSPYVDWFVIQDWPLRPYASDADHNYDAWAGIPALPEFNTDNPDVRDFLFDVAEHWMNFGIDGWRLDVPNEIDDDAFWRQFREVVKSANPEAYIVGEIWGDASRWLQGDQFDAVMNYPFLDPTLSFFGADTLRDYRKAHLDFEPLDAPAFAEEITELFARHDDAVTHAQLNLLDSHDMARARWILGGDDAAHRLSVLFQMTMPGAPCIYYGDEIGMASAGDPHCREAFPWEEREAWDEDLLDFYRQATALRHEYPVLRTGGVEFFHAEGEVVGVRRFANGAEAGSRNGGEGPAESDAAPETREMVLFFNAGSDAVRLTLDPDAVASDALARVWPPETASTATNGERSGTEIDLALDARPAEVHLPARSAQIWRQT